MDQIIDIWLGIHSGNFFSPEFPEDHIYRDPKLLLWHTVSDCSILIWNSKLLSEVLIFYMLPYLSFLSLYTEHSLSLMLIKSREMMSWWEACARWDYMCWKEGIYMVGKQKFRKPMAAPLLFQMLKFRGNIYAIITSPKEILCTSKYLNFNISSTHYAKKNGLLASFYAWQDLWSHSRQIIICQKTKHCLKFVFFFPFSFFLPLSLPFLYYLFLIQEHALGPMVVLSDDYNNILAVNTLNKSAPKNKDQDGHSLEK